MAHRYLISMLFGVLGLSVVPSEDTYAQASFPMKKIGVWGSEVDLAYYYAVHASPLIIVNRTVYLPDSRCVVLRHYGGSYLAKDLEGNLVTRTDGGDVEAKAFEGGEDERSGGAAVDSRTDDGEMDTKSAGFGDAKKDHAGETEKRQQAEEVITRSGDGSSEIKTADGSNEIKTTGGDGDARSDDGSGTEKIMDGAHESRNANATSDNKMYDGITLFIRCRPDQGNIDLVNYLSRQYVKLYDINGLSQVNAEDIQYE